MKSTELYYAADRFVQRLKADEDYTIDEKTRNVMLTDTAWRKQSKLSTSITCSITSNDDQPPYPAALKAHVIMKRDVDYVVQDGQVLIVDEFTGRIMTGRRYSDGLHQAIEAKEGLKVQNESMTLASITYQNYFRMYRKLAGMTGTAKTEEEEFQKIYGLNVVVIPTNKPMIRKDLPDVDLQDAEEQVQACRRGDRRAA